METRASKKKKKLLLQKEKEYKDQNEDRISNLSDAVSHHILSFLPINSIAQTSVLSKRWHYLWSCFPSLDFSDPDVGRRIVSCFPATAKLNNLKPNKRQAVESFITLILSRRHKHSNIQTFRLTAGDISPSCLSNCIRSLVNHKIEELDLDLGLNYRFNTPRCLLHCDSLKILRLKAKKELNPKRNDSNFRFLTASAMDASTLLRSLRSLSLTNIHFTDSHLINADLFSDSCFPLLKKLNLIGCEGLADDILRINCPKLEDLRVCNMKFDGLEVSGKILESLEVKGCFRLCSKESRIEILAPELRTFHWVYNGITEKCSLMSFPLLVDGFIYSFYPSGSKSAARVQSAANLLSGFSNAGYLVVGFDCIELLTGLHARQLPLPFSFHNLKTLLIHSSLNKYAIPGIACLLKSSPNLQSLSIMIFNIGSSGTFWNADFRNTIEGFSAEEYWESQILTFQGLGQPFLHHLEKVKITLRGNKVYENTINLVKFLLKHGCALREIVLSSTSLREENNPSLLQENIDLIKKFPHASPDVNIMLG